MGTHWQGNDRLEQSRQQTNANKQFVHDSTHALVSLNPSWANGRLAAFHFHVVVAERSRPGFDSRRGKLNFCVSPRSLRHRKRRMVIHARHL